VINILHKSYPGLRNGAYRCLPACIDPNAGLCCEKGASSLHCWKRPKRAFPAMQACDCHQLASPHLRPLPPPSCHHSGAHPHDRRWRTCTMELAPTPASGALGSAGAASRVGSRTAGVWQWREDEEADLEGSIAGADGA
jgi:hypothetical protein